MSFVQLDPGHFPPLNSEIQNLHKPPKKQHRNKGNRNHESSETNGFQPDTEPPRRISNGYDFITCRVGLQLNSYQENLKRALHNLSERCNSQDSFVVAHLEPCRSKRRLPEFEVLPDLVLPVDTWHTSVAIYISYPNLNHFDVESVEHFDKLLKHALYLSSPVVIIECPDYDLAHLTVASIVNDRLSESRKEYVYPLILFKVARISATTNIKPVDWSIPSASCSSLEGSPNSKSSHNSRVAAPMQSDEFDDFISSNHVGDKSHKLGTSSAAWHQWNSLREHLNPDPRLGVCLTLDEDLIEDEEELLRWLGEPVHMIYIRSDIFVKSPDFHDSLRLSGKCKEFIRRICLANSLKTALVIDGLAMANVKLYHECLTNLVDSILTMNPEPLRDWNDKIQPPLQPLSMDLNSGTYSVFESDATKYLMYQAAILSALKNLIETRKLDRKLVLMVVGAGRGPLVDATIRAIQELQSDQRFKIFAVDKNISSVQSLLYKQKTQWRDPKKIIETEVVGSDMRAWNPNVKADIIISELLGSLSDNELSPECLDGVWRFANPETISIPQEYSSYIAPICSYKMYQELNRFRDSEEYPFDQIYVVKLTNCYFISSPSKLFQFEHKDLSLAPSQRCNKRYTRSVFWSKTDTICHGFAGYFSSKLFGNTFISTLPETKTTNMDSWFPAFIPLETPVRLSKGTALEIHFWRKDSNSCVWYEWAITKPIRSRIYGQSGIKTAMSKHI